MNSKSIDLSHNIHYTWTVAGVGAGSIQVSVHFGSRCPFWVFQRMNRERKVYAAVKSVKSVKQEKNIM